MSFKFVSKPEFGAIFEFNSALPLETARISRYPSEESSDVADPSRPGLNCCFLRGRGNWVRFLAHNQWPSSRKAELVSKPL